MCITLLSTAHPDYPFILINNRDEFLSRPTAPAAWWDGPNSHVLGGRDLQREERGTWLGITRQGRLANLTNFREEGVEVSKDKSRGGLTSAYLTPPPGQEWSEEGFAKHLIDKVGLHDVGGFTLLYGTLRAPSSPHGEMPGLSVLSNRTSSTASMPHIATGAGEIHGLSNSHFGDLTWPKIIHGEQLLKQSIRANVDRRDDQDHFIEALFDILSIDTLPRPKEGEDFHTYTRQLRNSILIPPVGGQKIDSSTAENLSAAAPDSTPAPRSSHASIDANAYGTQQQSVILVNKQGHVTFVERTLYTLDGHPKRGNEGDRRIEFDIEGWDG
ncbi:hypothetical protein D0864_02358 [Hortaea werneckii]|uniref:Uncharacterized protein n=1 Tax=Hortaea werneckii TaxID=91943 RepID=A0A3M7HLH9_HORWE|nr:DUF833-domain-containing protein [Hortaea werneckii]KAI6876151.1 DUF833-domain-containing protein [Hortaea werneckii]KAI7359213.1 DUF833-domain-containing protein [Hortaea werneckii]KAI7608855.1 DUF833-domain-containing protein [Hortaea werneckii]KAI7675110.1 DUF833-domain-containing protein [Hortaea werneckii]